MSICQHQNYALVFCLQYPKVIFYLRCFAVTRNVCFRYSSIEKTVNNSSYYHKLISKFGQYLNFVTKTMKFIVTDTANNIKSNVAEVTNPKKLPKSIYPDELFMMTVVAGVEGFIVSVQYLV